jgi:hypothetical protein
MLFWASEHDIGDDSFSAQAQLRDVAATLS